MLVPRNTIMDVNNVLPQLTHDALMENYIVFFLQDNV